MKMLSSFNNLKTKFWQPAESLLIRQPALPAIKKPDKGFNDVHWLSPAQSGGQDRHFDLFSMWASRTLETRGVV